MAVGDQVAPSGWWWPGQTGAVSSRCCHRHVFGLTRAFLPTAPREMGALGSPALALRHGSRSATEADQRPGGTPWEFCRLEVTDGVGTIRLDRPKMNALNAQVQEEIRAAATEAAERDDVQAVVVWGGERVFAAGADIKEMNDMSYTDMVQRSGGLQSALHRGREDPQAGRRRGQRLRARRRLRARALRGRPVRRRGRRARPARDPARHHPRRRRHPAAHPPGRAQQGQGPDLHRPLRQGRRGARDRPGRPGRRAPTRCTPRRWPGPASSPAPRRTPCGRRRRASTAGSEVDLETGLEIERQQFAALFATEDRAIGMDPSSRTGRARPGSWAGEQAQGGDRMKVVNARIAYAPALAQVVWLLCRGRRAVPGAGALCIALDFNQDNALVKFVLDGADAVDLGRLLAATTASSSSTGQQRRDQERPVQLGHRRRSSGWSWAAILERIIRP